MLDKDALRDRSRWLAVTIRMPPELIIELDRLATQWNYYRYEVINELLVLAVERVDAEKYEPTLFPP